tara:strand:+ start:100284 stop:101189 length:906 start_codon:yes stop_codon:yes gene_type:complete
MFNPRIYIAHHVHAFIQAYKQLRSTPLSTLMTLAVLAIAIMLPTGLLVVLSNAQQLTARWNNGATIAMYLPVNLPDAQANEVLQQVKLRSDVANAGYISPQQGMQEFQKASGFDDAFAALKHNPLPGVIEVTPSNTSPMAMQQLKLQLQGLAHVESVQLDMQWVQRLFSIVSLGQQFVYGLLVILAIAVLLIIGNTIRTTVQRNQQQIHVTQLIGASQAFIRRPFLYAGVMYGLSAGIIAALILTIIIVWLQGSVRHLALLYNSQFHLQGLSGASFGWLILASIVLGFLGSWLAVGRYQSR